MTPVPSPLPTSLLSHPHSPTPVLQVTDVLRGHTYKWRCGHWFDAKEGRKKEWSAAAVMQGQPQALELVEAPAGEPGEGGMGRPPPPSKRGDAAGFGHSNDCGTDLPKACCLPSDPDSSHCTRCVVGLLQEAISPHCHFPPHTHTKPKPSSSHAPATPSQVPRNHWALHRWQETSTRLRS